jgi:amino acid adenylation domain-containing protein
MSSPEPADRRDEIAAPAAGSSVSVEPAALTEGEVQAILRDSRGTARDYPLRGGLRALFEQQARATPDAVAVVDENAGGRRISYAELDRYTGDIAARLQVAGVRAGDRVIVFMERAIEAVATLVAIIKSEAVYVPVDGSFPALYMQRIVDEIRPAVVLTGAGGREAFAAAEPAAQVLELIWHGMDSGRVAPSVIASGAKQSAGLEARTGLLRSARNDESEADDPFLTIYTSGSTGEPKGVVHRQRQVLNRLHWMWEAYPFDAGEVMCQRSPLGVMPSLWELLGGLLRGVPTVIASREVVRDPARLADFVARHGVTRMTVPSSSFLKLADAARSTGGLGSLRVVTIGGEMLTPDFYARFHVAAPQAVMVEDYGSTETNTVWHYALAPRDFPVTEPPGGRPIANVGAYILDRDGRLAPRGAVGELAVAGISLAIDYVGKPEQYARAFVPNHIDPTMGALLYRTGDLAWRQADGAIRLVGRADHQLKIRGLRVEPSEVEGVLAGHADVEAGCVTQISESDGGGELVAFVVRRPQRRATAAEIRTFMAGRLPSHMVPGRILFVDGLPLLPNGKLDRRQVAQRAAASVAKEPDAAVVARLRHILSDLLGQPLDLSADWLEFNALGVDSANAVAFASRLTSELGLTISPTILYEHCSLRALASHVGTARAEPKPAALLRRSSTGTINPSRPPSRDIAIVGMSCRMPDADDAEEFWANLAAGHSSISEIPADRWSTEGFYSPERSSAGTSISKWGAFLRDIRSFDPLMFGISPADAAYMDPQIRIGLEEAWRAFEDAGHCPDSLADETVGIFIGLRKGEFDRLIDRRKLAPNAALMLGSDPSMLAGRIAHRLDLHGPSVTVDTACSSSMTALHLACQSLATGESSMALVGGVCIALSPDFFVATSRLGIFSPTGRSRSFDRDADGTVQGEGAGFLVLKSLDRAVAEGDHIHAVIKGTAIAQDGRTNGIGAPNVRSQAAMQRRLREQLGIDPATISLVEAHGTGTQIGDPIEIEALMRSFGPPDAGRLSCAIGSVKTNIGHLNAAAGIAGVIKTALALQHRQIPPSLGFDTPNPRIDFAAGGFHVADRLTPWHERADCPRRAAVNSFGMSGAIGHCVLEEAPVCDAPADEDAQPHLFVFTARSADALHRNVHRFRAWLDMAGRQKRLRDISFTLLTGRERHPLGISVVAASHEELALALDGFESSLPKTDDRRATPDGDLIAEFGDYLFGRITSDDVDDVRRRRMLGALGQLALQPVPLKLARLFENGRRVALPTYSFDAVNCWPPEDVLLRVGSDTVQPVLAQPVLAQPVLAQPVLAMETAVVRAPGADPVRDAGPSPADALRQRVRAAVAGFLGIAAEELTDATPFANYGFDSAAAIDLSVWLQRALNVDMPISALADEVSLDALMERLHGLLIFDDAQVNEPVAVALSPEAPSDESFPLTDLQAAHFVAKADGGEGVGCHTYLEIEVADLDLDRLSAAWNRLVAHHPMLRMRVTAAGRQEIQSSVPHYDIRSDGPLAGTDFTAHVARVRAEMSHKVYPVETWPLFELRASRRPDGSALVHVSMDSWIVDAPGADILHEDFFALYADPGRRLDPSTAQFRDHVAAVNEWRQSDAGRRERDSWRQRLAGSPPGPRFDQPTVATPPRRFQCRNAHVDRATWAAIRDFSAETGIFAASVVLACFMRSLASSLRQDDFSVVVTHSRRDRLDLAGVRAVGPYTTTSLCSATAITARPLRDLAVSLDHQIRASLDSPGLCMAGVIGKETRRTGIPRRFPVVFTAQLSEARRRRAESWLDHAVYVVSQTPGVALENRVALRDDGLDIVWNFEEGQLPPASAAAMLERFAAELRVIGGDCKERERGEADPPTALQRVYLAERQRADPGRWPEATVYQEFEVDDLDLDRLAAALERLVARWPALRRRPVAASGEVEQAGGPPAVQFEDITLVRPELAELRLSAIRRNMLASFERPGTPAVRVKAVRLAPRRSRLHIVTDMVVADAYSVFLIYVELFGMYAGKSHLRLPRPVARAAVADEDRAYWIERVRRASGGPRLARIAGAPDPNALPAGRLIWTRDLWPALAQCAARRGVSPEAVMATALAAVLRRRVRGGDFTIVVAITGRDRVVAPAADSIGDFTRLSWVTEPRDEASFADRCARIEAELRDDLAHSGFGPIEALAHVAGQDGGVSPSRIVMTSCLTQEPLGWPLGGPQKFACGYGLSLTPHVDLDCCLNNIDGRLGIHWDYRTAAFADSLIGGLFDDYCRLVEQLLTREDAWNSMVHGRVQLSSVTPRIAVGESA